MKKFENKTLLVLGSSTGSVDIVNYAKKMELIRLWQIIIHQKSPKLSR